MGLRRLKLIMQQTVSHFPSFTTLMLVDHHSPHHEGSTLGQFPDPAPTVKPATWEIVRFRCSAHCQLPLCQLRRLFGPSCWRQSFRISDIRSALQFDRNPRRRGVSGTYQMYVCQSKWHDHKNPAEAVMVQVYGPSIHHHPLK